MFFHQTTSVFAICTFFCIFLISCSKATDKTSFEEVLATKSLERADEFFMNYPESAFKDRLVNEIINWCKEGANEELVRQAIEVIPENHPQYKELVSYYEKRFGPPEGLR